MYLCLTIHFLATSSVHAHQGWNTCSCSLNSGNFSYLPVSEKSPSWWTRSQDSYTIAHHIESRNTFGMFTALHVVVLEIHLQMNHAESSWMQPLHIFRWWRFLYHGEFRNALGIFTMYSYILFIFYAAYLQLEYLPGKTFLQRWLYFHILFAGCSFYMTLTLK